MREAERKGWLVAEEKRVGERERRWVVRVEEGREGGGVADMAADS